MNQNKLIYVDLGDNPNIYNKILKDNYIPKYLRDIKLVTGRRNSYRYVPFIINTNCTDINVYINKLHNLIKKELDIEFGLGRLTGIVTRLETVIIDNDLYIKTTLDELYSLLDTDLLKLLPFINVSMRLANQCIIDYYIKTYIELDNESMSMFIKDRYLLNEMEIPYDFKNRLLAIRDKSPDSFKDYKWYTTTFKYVIFGKEKLDTLSFKEISDVLMSWSPEGISHLFTLLNYDINYIELMKTITYRLEYNDTSDTL